MNSKSNLVFILLIYLLMSCTKIYKIPSSSMEPTLEVGDSVKIISSSDYIPQRGDIIIHSVPNKNDKKYIKRCIAIGGDNISFNDGVIILNKEKLNEPYVKGITTLLTSSPDIEGKVPQNCIVVLGDNRENSYDSRSFGYLKVENVLGKVEKIE